MESTSQEAAASAFADSAMSNVLSAAASPSPASVPPATTREEKIDEVMSFMHFSVKPTSSFEGSILFKFNDKEDASAEQVTYLVTISDNKEVVTKKNATAKDAKVTCEVAMSMEDFLYIYSGKASSSDVVKLFYAGRVSISGYAFRTMSNFVSSFDYSTETWNSFYAWRDRQAQQQRDGAGDHRTTGALDEANNMGSPSRDFWFYYCRAILERHSISKLQRITWEASLASLFGDQFILDNLRRSVQSRRSFSLPKTGVTGFASKQQVGLISALVGLHAPPSRMENELAHFFHPTTTRRHSIATSLSVPKADDAADVFDFFDEDYVDAVKYSAKHRIHRAQNKNRVDLADAGMEQLDKLLVALGKDGHRNKQCKTKARYIPAPELLLREFQSHATELVHVIQEKALGRKRVDRIPPPDMAWLLGSDSGVLVVTDNDASDALATNASSSRVAQALVVVDRSQTQRRGSLKRDFEVPKQKLIAKLNSLSRDLAQRNSSAQPLSFDDHIMFSDYA